MPDKRVFLAKIILLAVMIWQPAVAQMSSLLACTAVDDTDNDGVDSTIDIDKDGDGLIEVCDIEGLNEMRYQLDGSGYTTSTDAVKIIQGCPATGCKGYELMRSLDFNVADSYRDNMVNTTWTTSTGWQPIGSNANRFSSIFEGNGHTISNLYIKAESQLGLFSVLRANGRIQNVGLLDAEVEGIGDSIGGLVYFSDGSIINSYVTGAVTGTGDNVGGLVGSNSGDITNSYATGGVTGIGDNVGGLVGSNGGDITNSYAMGAVTGNSEVGGLVGFNRGRVTNSYATGAVTGNSNVGGLVGSNSGDITNSYATGVVTGNSNVGGLVGWSFRGSVTNSYWNTQTSGLATSAGGDGVTSATTVQLQSPTASGTTTTEVYYGWSSDDWDFGTSSQYPILKKSDGTLLSPTLRYGLSQLRLAQGHLSPDFISIIPNYTGSVVVDTNTIQLIPIAINANARIHITGGGTQEIVSGATSDDIMLNEDGITTITIVVMTAGISIEYNFNLRYYQYSGDVDIDNDGLIEIDTIEDLNAIRYQSDGTGYKKGTAPKITTGCPSTGCKGYELTRNLSFAADNDWSPIALFSGIFEGNGYTISKLRINKPNASNLGLFSSITSGAKINNMGLLDIDIQGDSGVGSLVGSNYGRITNSYAMGVVTGTGDEVGGLVGENNGRITNSYAMGAVTGIGDEVGGLVGENNGRITNSYATGTVTGTDDDVGGLVGFNGGSVTNSYATGTVTGNSGVGGFVGWNFRGSVTNSYATGAVTGNSNVGGLVGVDYFGGSVTNSYATGAVTGNDNVGGLIGINYFGSVTNSYATGVVTGNSNVGGLVGWSFRGSVTNSYWNTQTSGLATSAGGDGVTSATTVQLQSPTASGTTTTEVYYGWSSDDWDFGTSSQYPILKKSDGTLLSPTLRYGLSQLRLAKGHLSPDFISIIPNYIGSVVVDTNTIQLIPIAINTNARIHITGRGTQEIASGATSDDIMLNEDGITTITIIVMAAGISIEYNFNLRYYQYSGDVDIDNDGLIEIDTIEDLNAIRYQSDGTGYKKGTAPKITTGCPSTGCKGYELTKSLSFAADSDWSPIALFSGIFEGNGYTISKLRINKPNASNLGLFSSITSGAKINNIGLLDIDIQGDSWVGGLVGFNYGRITNSYATGAVTGNSKVGGLVGFNYGRITNSYAMGAVAGNSRVGGLVGDNGGRVTNSYAMGAVTGNSGVGGLAGSNNGDITNSYATEAVTGNSRVGGLVGVNYDNGSVTNSYATRAVTGTGDNVGGLVGVNYDNGSVTNSYATGTVTGTGDNVGGLVGSNRGRVTNSYATGAVTGNSNVGGLVGSNRGRVTNSYATGAVTGNSNVGGLVGSNRGSVTNSYWNTQTSGLATSAGGDGVTSATTVQLQSPTAPGTTPTEVYYGWSSDDWDFGTPSQYPILKKSDGTLLSPTLRYGLSQLRLAKGHLSPDFINIIPNYTGSVVVDTNTIQLIPIAINANARIHITGRRTQEIASGATSDDIMLNEDGITTITIIVMTAGISIEYNFNLRYYQYSGDVDIDNDGLIEIDNIEDLSAIRYQLDGTGYKKGTAPKITTGCPSTGCKGYELTKSLSFAADNDWSPIALFSGIFEGNGYTISKLTINKPNANSVGLFSSITSGAKINNIGLLDIDIQGDSYVGGLVGFNYGRITNSYATGAVTGNSRVGGLVGDNEGRVTNSYATGAVTGNSRVGGLVGDNEGRVTNSYATGAVTGNSGVGGLVSYNDGNITNSYAMGAVTGNSGVGGLVGVNYFGRVTNSYATGAVTGTGDNVGGLVGWNSSGGRVIASYWDTKSSGIESSGIESSGGGSGKTTAGLQTPIVPGTTTTEVYYRWNTSDWDFGDSNHYPALRYASGADPAICTTDITTSSAVLPCTLLLPEQRGRDRGLAEVFFFAGGEVVSVILTPPFTPLTDSYDMLIIIPENTDPEMQLRPYAINDNAMIVVTEPGSATDYYAGKSNSELSDTIVLSDETILRIAVTDSIDQDVDHTTYTFTIAKASSLLAISEIMIEPSATIDEGSHTTITYTVSGGSGVYEYAYKIDDGAFTQSSSSFVYRSPFNLVESYTTTQAVSITIRVSDQDESVEVLEHSKVLTIRKVNNGFADIAITEENNILAVTVGSDPDGDPDPADYTYQWQSRALGTDSKWTNIMSATDNTYTIPENVSGEFRVQVTYTDRQGYKGTLESADIVYLPLVKGIKVRTKVFLEGGFR